MMVMKNFDFPYSCVMTSKWDGHVKADYLKVFMKCEPVLINVQGAQESESIPSNRFRQAENRFLGSLKGLQIRPLIKCKSDRYLVIEYTLNSSLLRTLMIRYFFFSLVSHPMMSTRTFDSFHVSL
jgi:hypothetical protein